jgi:hypothetical protein
LYNEGFHNSYSLSNILRKIRSRRIRWGDIEPRWGTEKYVQNFSAKTAKSRLHGRHRNKWEDGIKMALWVIRSKVWEHAQNRVKW